MHQKERDFLEELNELELILKEFVYEAFIKKIEHSAGDRTRFYLFLRDYNKLKIGYYKMKGADAERRYKKADEMYNSLSPAGTFNHHHKYDPRKP
ncbi:MAG: hypothetical protein PHH54_03175 [Candidatus Nanoarchaeia archaeon]|nr:hypothetical protein [Candidatus Nanoarchaeia archaeon]MDD5740961.1 hypothetical protein [Candidatus Nanoarchaeia archaeon]